MLFPCIICLLPYAATKYGWLCTSVISALTEAMLEASHSLHCSVLKRSHMAHLRNPLCTRKEQHVCIKACLNLREMFVETRGKLQGAVKEEALSALKSTTGIVDSMAERELRSTSFVSPFNRFDSRKRSFESSNA